MPDPTALLQAWGRGEAAAFDALVPLVYDELRRVARRQLGLERAGHSLQPTALVHEVFLRLIDGGRVGWRDRAHFFALSSRAMRRILVDAARSRRARKRGAGAVRVTLDERLLVTGEAGHDVVALHDALELLGAVDARKAAVVEMRFFGGVSVEETAAALGVSVDTVMRDWRLAKVWLVRELQRETRRDA